MSESTNNEIDRNDNRNTERTRHPASNQSGREGQRPVKEGTWQREEIDEEEEEELEFAGV